MKKSSESDKSQSRGKGKMRCFHCKKYDHMRRDCPERSDMKKGDNPSTTLARD